MDREPIQPSHRHEYNAAIMIVAASLLYAFEKPAAPDTSGGDHEPPVVPLDTAAIGPPPTRLYWAGGNTVSKANLDGTAAEEVIHLNTPGTPGTAPGDFPTCMVLDPSEGALCWVTDHRLQRVNLSGSGGVNTLTDTAFGSAEDLEFDPVGRRFYWPMVGSCDAKGNEPRDIDIGSGRCPDGYTNTRPDIAIDPARRYLYFTQEVCGWFGPVWTLVRMHLDTHEVTYLDDFPVPANFVVDTLNSKLMWATGKATVGIRVHSVRLDKTVPEMQSSNLDWSSDRTPDLRVVDARRQKLYWTVPWLNDGGDATPPSGMILCSDVDGSNVEVITEQGIADPTDLVVDEVANRVYWADPLDYAISYIDMDDGSTGDIVKYGPPQFLVKDRCRSCSREALLVHDVQRWLEH